MDRKIKLIWDFRGVDGLETAKHHKIHLEEFAVREQLAQTISGVEELSKDAHSIAYIVVAESEMLKVRDALMPHRGELFA